MAAMSAHQRRSESNRSSKSCTGIALQRGGVYHLGEAFLEESIVLIRGGAEHPADLDAPRSPIPADIPRPSISPLSAKASPVAVRDAVMRISITEEDITTNDNDTAAEVGDQDDRSSSLSEPEEDIEDPEIPNGSKDELETSEESVAHQSLEVDSEAETERLDQTPHKTRRDAEGLTKTPSKLQQAAAADEDLSEPPSPIPIGPGAASSTSTVETSVRKRKRSDTADSSLSSADSDLGESPRKRSHSSAVADTVAEPPTTDIRPPAFEEPDASEEVVVAGTFEPTEATLASPVKGVKARKGPKTKGRPKKEAVKETEPERVDEAVQPERHGDEALAQSAEQFQHSQAATTAFEDLAKSFTAFRSKMCSEKIAAVDAELDLLNQPDSKHPEYLRQVACVNSRYQKQVSETEAYYRYKQESLRRTVLGERSQLHSQYFQHTRQLRETTMDELGDDWYRIQNERRQSSLDKDEHYIYKFPTKKSDQIKQQAKYNQEVSVLSGIAKYVGFPAAPDVAGAEGDMLEGDLKAMKISRRAHQSNTHPQPVYFPNRTGLIPPQSERIAHEQFIEQNPWARPQGPIQHHGTPNLTHTPDWAAEPGTHISKHLSRTVGGTGVPHAGSPYMTPMAQKRALQEHSSSGTVAVNSDGAEMPSSVAAAPPTENRSLHGIFGSRDAMSPLAMAKHRQNGAETRELTGYRNISNISGASTIDAPESAEKIREAGPGKAKEVSAPKQVFDTSQLQRHVPQNEVYSNPSFRPQEGAYGPPIPLPGPP